jgi:hypothetical protein
MKPLINIVIGIAMLSLAIGIVSRLTATPVPFAKLIEAGSFLAFTNTCLLIAITLLLLQTAKAKQ